MRFIIIAAAIALIAFWVFRAARGSSSSEQLPKEDQKPGQFPKSADSVQEMVSCAQCGLHLPKAEAVTGKRALYCTLEHQRQAES